jgi:hypothetical protein
MSVVKLAVFQTILFRLQYKNSYRKFNCEVKIQNQEDSRVRERERKYKNTAKINIIGFQVINLYAVF